MRSCSWCDNIQSSQIKLDNVTFIGQGDRKITLKANSEMEMVKWVCAIDTVRNNCNGESILNPMDKVNTITIVLLEFAFNHLN